MTDRISELEARIAADTAELERLKAEPDWERYRGMLAAMYASWGSIYVVGNRHASDPDAFEREDYDNIRALLAARNHDPDVVALVQWARGKRTVMDDLLTAKLFAPFAAIKGD